MPRPYTNYSPASALPATATCYCLSRLTFTFDGSSFRSTVFWEGRRPRRPLISRSLWSEVFRILWVQGFGGFQANWMILMMNGFD